MGDNGESQHSRPLGQAGSGEGSLEHNGQTLPYRVQASWLTLIDEDREPTAAIFYTAYTLGNDVDGKRPLTFLFNGGPGAASAYLHLGAAGPVRARFNDDGTAPAMPVELVDNLESWLPYTDLVCVDPVGAGFSRALPKKGSEADSDGGGAKLETKTAKSSEPFWEVGKDLDSLTEFIKRYLSQENRWLSPILLAGESYGGYRVARLAKRLQGFGGVGLTGVLLISPGIEFDGLIGTDYDLVHWIETLPSMAASAHFHGRAGVGRRLEEHLAAAEEFVEGDFVQLLLRGEALDAEKRRAVVETMSGLIGLSARFIDFRGGRITREAFCRELLRDEGLYCGLHDASMKGPDPFPDRDHFAGPDPVIDGQAPMFSMGINAHLRGRLGVKTDLSYDLINMQANQKWKNTEAEHLFAMQLASLDDLRYGMAANPHLKVSVCYGYYDVVTPYYEARRLTRLMKLSEKQKPQLRTHYFAGGHMFYAYRDSRAQLAKVAADLCTSR